jgi:hypothetical protein
LRKLRAIPIAILVVLAGGATALASLGGNPQGVALANKVLSAFSKVHGYAYTEKGYFSMKSGEGRTSYFDYVVGTAKAPKGYVRANESAQVGIRGGKGVWWRDELTPVSAGSNHATVPVEIVVDHAGEFAAFGSVSHHTCFAKLHGLLPFTVGEPPYTIAGTLSAPQPDGASQVLTYVYPWTKTQTATEHDTINSATDLMSAAKVSIGAGGGQRGFSFTTKNTYPSKLSAPKVKVCK